MSGSFELTLDTTGPRIEIVVPAYTVPGILTEIWIDSNEPIGRVEEFYIVDATGFRIDLSASGFVLHNFNGVGVGIATIYARVTDDVFNVSSLATRTINVLAASKISLRSNNMTPRRMMLNAKSRPMKLARQTGNLTARTYDRHMQSGRARHKMEVTTIAK